MRAGPLSTLLSSLSNKEQNRIKKSLQQPLLKLFLEMTNPKMKVEQVKNLPYLKNQLYKKILSHLKHETIPEKEFVKRINDYKINATILLERGLYKLAMNELQKGRRFVKELDVFNSLEFGNRLRVLMHEHEPDLEKIQQLSSECQKELNVFHSEMQMRQVHEEIYLKIRNKIKITPQDCIKYNNTVANIIGIKAKLENIESITKVIKTIFITNDKETMPQLSLNLIFYLYHTLYLFHKNYIRKHSLSFLSDVVEIISQYPDYQIAYSSRYLNLLNNVLNTQLVENRTLEMEHTIERLKEFIIIDAGIKNKKKQHYDYYRILLFMKSENYKKAYEVQKEIFLSSWKQYENILPISRKLVFSYNLSCICLITENHQQTQFWYEKILAAPRKIRPDIRLRTRLIEVITLFDKDFLEDRDNNVWRSKYLLKLLIEFVRAQKNKDLFFLSITKNIRSIINADIEHREVEMSKTLNDWSGNEKMENGYEEFLHWLKQRCSRFNL